jgi:hypothetical protein
MLAAAKNESHVTERRWQAVRLSFYVIPDMGAREIPDELIAELLAPSSPPPDEEEEKWLRSEEVDLTDFSRPSLTDTPDAHWSRGLIAEWARQELLTALTTALAAQRPRDPEGFAGFTVRHLRGALAEALSHTSVSWWLDVGMLQRPEEFYQKYLKSQIQDPLHIASKRSSLTPWLPLFGLGLGLWYLRKTGRI